MAEALVVGGEGFLGRHLVSALVDAEYETCATYNYTPPEDSKHLRNLSHFRIDVTDFNQCLKLINQEAPEIIYHLVAQPIVTAALRHPFSTMELTIRGSYNLLEAVRQTGKNVKSIVYVSSDKVYGNNTMAKEFDVLAGIDHPYNVSKVAGDVIAQMYAKAYGLPVVISRSANLYGGGDFHWDRLVPGISRNILQEETPTIRSNGKQVRDYIYVEDSVRGLIAMADAKIEKGSIFNFGSDDSFTTIQIVDKLLKISGRIDLIPLIQYKAKDEIDAQHIDYSKANEVLGWEPKVEIDDGLERTFAWYKNWFGTG